MEGGPHTNGWKIIIPNLWQLGYSHVIKTALEDLLVFSIHPPTINPISASNLAATSFIYNGESPYLSQHDHESLTSGRTERKSARHPSHFRLALTKLGSVLYVSGFSSNLRAKDLAWEFERYGRLVRCDIPAPKGPSATGKQQI